TPLGGRARFTGLQHPGIPCGTRRHRLEFFMPIWTLVKKEIRLLLRDPLATLILVAMPLLFILVLGRRLGEPDDRLRITVVDLDKGPGLDGKESWSKTVQRDLAETAGIRVEVLPSLEEAQRMVAYHQRAAVLVFKPNFS